MTTAAPQPRVQVPASAMRGDIVQVRTLITHQMETGLRKDAAGLPIPRKIINSLVCRYNGTVVFSADLHEAVAANPYMEFFFRAEKSGTLEFAWHEDGGAVFATQCTFAVVDEDGEPDNHA
jgi:sulfur-oxidizing protein SoxZ